MLSPSTSALKTVNYAPKKIPENMIGYAQTPHKINENIHIPILPSLLINPTKYGITILESGFTDDCY